MAPTHPSMQSRRDILKLASLAGASAMMAGMGQQPAAATPAAATGTPAPANSEPRRLVRLAHITDLHIQTNRRAPQGVAACLQHIAALPDQPDFVMTGGDLINDGYANTEKGTREQFGLLTTALKDHLKLPVEHCLGNHDIFGWNKQRSEATGNEPFYGKRWASDVLGLEKWYRSFNRKGVHFVVLDSVQPWSDTGYSGGLDNEQFEWLKGDLAKVPAQTPIVVVSHIPIFSFGAAIMDTRIDEKAGIEYSAGSIFRDAHRVIALFDNHKNVKLALSGHIHIEEDLAYNGVRYMCSGAVSGAWWRTPEADQRRRARQEQERAGEAALARLRRSLPGYRLVDVFSDGSVRAEYVNYGWKFEQAESQPG